jgi:hypothetical protein
MQRPSEHAALAANFGVDVASAEREARASLRETLLPSALFVLTLIVAKTGLPAVGLASLVAAAIDLVRSIRSERADPDRVVIWEERRAWAVPALRGALESQGIGCHVRGLAYFSIWQIFAPYAPVQFLVDPADAQRASQVFLSLQSPEASLVRDKSGPDDATTSAGEPEQPILARSQTIALGACALAAAVVAWMPPTH